MTNEQIQDIIRAMPSREAKFFTGFMNQQADIELWYEGELYEIQLLIDYADLRFYIKQNKLNWVHNGLDNVVEVDADYWLSEHITEMAIHYVKNNLNFTQIRTEI